MLCEEVSQDIARAFCPLYGSFCLEFSLRKSVGVDSPSRNLYLWLEVLVVGIDGNPILEPDGCYLDWVIVFEASCLGVKCVEVCLVLLL